MRLAVLLSLIMLAVPGSVAMRDAAADRSTPEANASYLASGGARRTVVENNFDLSEFGAIGDGVADDGPALQSALNAMASAGGGTLFVPAGRYAINTPVHKDFTGLADSVTILGVESSTPVPPPTANGNELSQGLDLVSEFLPRTHQQNKAITIAGLETFLIKDISFMGTPGVSTDALVTLALHSISEATIRHCEFYGLASLVATGSIIESFRSNLTFEKSVVLGSACSSGNYSSIIENVEWKGITVSEAVFIDYGQRPELYGKMDNPPFSWVSIGNAAVPDVDSPRREAVFRSVFLDEGGYIGISSLTYRYAPPVSAPIDLVYITDLFMNVSNLGTTGHHLYGLERVMIEKSHYGWSHNTDGAINLLSVGNAILDEIECVASANRIRADAATGKLTVINSTYTYLDSLAQTTKVITTATPDEDPVQHVRQQFMATLGRAPDPAAHFYWSDLILQCGADAACVADKRAALATYLGSTPAAKFGITGRVTNASGANLPGVAVTLSGSQSVTTTTDSAGQYHFSNLPTSGIYTVTPTLNHHTLNPSSRTITTPSGDQVFDSAASFNYHTISGRVVNTAGDPLSGATVTLSGSQNATMTTGTAGNYSFPNLPAGGNYNVTAQKTSYTFSPVAFPNLGANQNLNFTGTLVTYTISGVLVGINNNRKVGVTVTLSGWKNATTTSDNDGNFYFPGLDSQRDYTVTATLVEYSFNPLSRTYTNLGANHYENSVATYTTHSVTGRVTETASGMGLSGAVVTLSGYNSGATTTDVNGNYHFDLPRHGTYTLTVTKTDYTIAQPTQTITNLTSNQTANFAATLNGPSISGRTTAPDGSALAGVVVTLSGSQAAATSTDINGAFTFANVPAGGNYTVKPSKTSYAFAPQTLVFNGLGSNQTANFTGTFVNHKISGRVTKNGAGLSGVSVLISGSQTSTTTTDDTGGYSFTVPSEGNYTITPSKQDHSFTPSVRTFNNLIAPQTADFGASPQSFLEFSQSSYTVTEGTATITITVTRTGDTSEEATVTYLANNGSGTQGKDLSAVIGELVFAAAETSRSFTIFITDDAFVESPEQLVVTLSDVAGATLGNSASTTLTINDNDNGTANSNPLDDASFFVRQHYRDFLNREPDDAGLAFWSDQIRSCGTNAECTEVRRINVSAAFFLSIEFQETGFLVHRVYKAAFAQPPRYLDQFLLDSRTLAQGVVVNTPGWQQLLEDNKTAFLNDFVERSEFTDLYPLSLTPAEFVDSLNAQAGAPLTTDGIAAAVAEFNGSASSSDTLARARVLRRVAESQTFLQRETSPAFVLMQYFGYLQRNPSDPPNNNLDGYNFWLSKLDEFGGDFRRAEMVKAFLASIEYRSRFGL